MRTYINMSDIYPTAPRQIKSACIAANFMRQGGVMPPIKVVKVGDKYAVVNGKTRYLAAKLIDRTIIHAEVMSV